VVNLTSGNDLSPKEASRRWPHWVAFCWRVSPILGPCTIEGIEAGPKHTSRGPLILVIAVLSFDHNTLVDKGETGSVRVAVR
jgi:hypothetical protein